jgi:hypothetical protein
LLTLRQETRNRLSGGEGLGGRLGMKPDRRTHGDADHQAREEHYESET